MSMSERDRERWKWRVVSVKQSFFFPFTLENPSARLVVINLISPPTIIAMKSYKHIHNHLADSHFSDCTLVHEKCLVSALIS